MYYNHADADRLNSFAEKYDELKNFLLSKNDKGELNEFVLAYSQLIIMESTIKDQKEKIQKYELFFNQLATLLPKTPSVFDRIG